MENGLRLLRTCLPATDPEIATSLSNIGTFYYKNQDYVSARRYYEECYSIQKASLPERHPDITRTVGYMHRTIAQLDMANRASKEVTNLEICESINGTCISNQCFFQHIDFHAEFRKPIERKRFDVVHACENAYSNQNNKDLNKILFYFLGLARYNDWTASSHGNLHMSCVIQ